MPETEINFTDPVADLNSWPAMKTGWHIIFPDGKPTLEVRFLFNTVEYFGLLKVKVQDLENRILTAVYTLPPDPDAAVDKACYSFDANISILGITLNDDNRSVDIAVGNIPQNAPVTLSVNEMKFPGTEEGYSGSAAFSTNAEYKGDSSMSIKATAGKDLYGKVLKITDPEQKAKLMLKSGLFPETAFMLNDKDFDLWLKNIFAFLEALSEENSVADMPVGMHQLRFTVDPAAVCKDAVSGLFLIPYPEGGRTPDLADRAMGIPLLPGSPEGDPGYTEFVEQLESIFPPEEEVRVAFEKGSGEKPDIENVPAWAVRLAAKEASASAVAYRMEDQDTAVLFAPRPVFTSLLSKENIPAPVFHPATGLDFSDGRTMVYKDVDLNLWFREFFKHFDSLADPAYEEWLKLKEDGTDQGMTFGEKLESQRLRLAGLLKTLLVTVSEGETAAAGEIQEHFSKWVSGKLSLFYELKSVVPLKSAVNPNNLATGHLSGQLIPDSWEGNGIPAIRTAVTDLPLHKGGSANLYMMLYAPAETPENSLRLPVSPELSYQAVSVEDCRIRQGTTETPPVSFGFFTGDHPLFSVRKLTGAPTQVPLPLHQNPVTPVIFSPAGNLTDPGDNFPSGLLQWDFRFSYDHQNLQDKVYFTVYDHQHESVESEAGQQNFSAFDELAQLLYLLPQFQEAFQKLTLTTPGSTPAAIPGAQTLLKTYTGMTDRFISRISVDEWQGGHPDGRKHEDPEGLFSFTIKEDVARIDHTDDALIMLIGMSDKAAALYGRPEIQIEGYETRCFNNPETLPETEAYYFTRNGRPLSSTEAGNNGIRSRTIALKGMNIIDRNTVSVSAFIKRNEELLPGKPVNQGFVMKSPTHILPAFFMEVMHHDAVDITSFAPAGHRTYPLQQYLSFLFSWLLQKNKEAELNFSMAVNYEYTLAGTGIPLQLPVLLVPDTVLTDPANRNAADPEIAVSLAASVNTWLQTHIPDQENATLIMDLSLYRNGGPKQPLFRLSRLFLRMEDLKP
ncbi:hypothetical protein [uncultured Chryseobacterium sp.]|uniref:hypothetical protein n=1 Tax=uncultured Chryseobacterium sp. TaxID=259322 RepID=UPI0025E81077|nr:hypothetical protein [uncultured Chryseobacterium sp.]